MIEAMVATIGSNAGGFGKERRQHPRRTSCGPEPAGKAPLGRPRGLANQVVRLVPWPPSSCCLSCGHIYQNPRPSPEAASTIYPDTHLSFAGTIAGSVFVSRAKRQAILRRLKDLLAGKHNLRILEIGFGDGDLLLAIRRYLPDAELEGLDFHVHPDTAAKLEANRIKLRGGMAEAMRLDDNAYDVIIMNQLVEHLWDVEKVFEACCAALKPGGCVSIETPDSSGCDRKLFRGGAWGSYYFPRHLNVFSQYGLRRILMRNGFEVVKVYSTVAPMCWVFTMMAIGRRHVAWSWLRKIFTPTNVLPIAVFTAVDLVAIGLGLTSSNQRMVVRKVH
jgi:ubiquinone/menaquinone biosynthesis C-methylase UbiE